MNSCTLSPLNNWKKSLGLLGLPLAFSICGVTMSLQTLAALPVLNADLDTPSSLAPSSQQLNGPASLFNLLSDGRPMEIGMGQKYGFGLKMAVLLASPLNKPRKGAQKTHSKMDELRTICTIVRGKKRECHDCHVEVCKPVSSACLR